MNTNFKYLSEFLSGKTRALAKAISLIENNPDSAEKLLDELYAHTGNAYRIGITGPPGAGKSTLVDGLAKHFRAKNKSVGILAVDPTSPFTGGALLGDRIRMSDITLDDHVFIRSMASRGSLGGLSGKINDAADLLDAFGKEIIMIETVGVGQSELDIIRSADTVVVVLVPESGDAIQAMKAGLMEIADLFILNKADREGAERAVIEIEAMLRLKLYEQWQPPVLKAVASTGKGINEIGESLDKHLAFLSSHTLWQKKRVQRKLQKIQELVRTSLEQTFWSDSHRKALLTELNNRETVQGSPYALARKLLQNYRKQE